MLNVRSQGFDAEIEHTETNATLQQGHENSQLFNTVGISVRTYLCF